MSNVLGTYSAKDLNLTLSFPSGTVQIAGVNSQGLNKLTVRMTTIQTTMQVGADGAVVPSAIPGDQGVFEIEVWQTSTLHNDLLAAYNAQKVARDQGDVSQWAGASIIAQNIVNGTGHKGTGVAFEKVPDKTYGKEATTVTWMLMAANIANT